MFSPKLKDWWDDVVSELKLYFGILCPTSQSQLTPVDDAFVFKSFGPGTKLRGWHLQVIGVLPEYQQQGIATQVINTVKNIVRS